MPDPAIDALRDQLRDRGYLSHGIERWFALDPWSSRTFWVELAIVALKAATLIAAFAALPHTAILVLRNQPLGAIETLVLFALYGCGWLALTFGLVLVAALLLKIRPELALDTPRALLGISIGAAALLVAAIAAWWYRFETPPSAIELAAGCALAVLLFVVATIVVSAALLSFSIYELQRIPAIHQKPRTIPMGAAAIALAALLFVPAFAQSERIAVPPVQVVTHPNDRRIALVGVDGLTWDIARSQPALMGTFASTHRASAIDGASAAERWASLGTGVAPHLHGVRAVAGVRIIGGEHILQSVSRGDGLLRAIAPAIGIAELQPLPPTVRRRDFVWEVFAARGVSAVAVNWWTSPGQDAIFAASKGDPNRLDALAIQRVVAAQDGQRFVTVYLPGLDVILNRTGADSSARLASSIRALDRIAAAVQTLRERGFDVILAGMPGEGQQGDALVATTFASQPPGSARDVAPTLCALFGFPASNEMRGKTFAATEEPRIASYGERSREQTSPKLNQEYYESLKSLGYIK